MQRILEPEVMDTPEEAIEYDAMDFTEVNTAFARSAIDLAPPIATVLDAGTGTARIPILISEFRPNWRIIAIDLAVSMLELGRKNIALANCQDRIQLERVDVKRMPYANRQFDLVISNSLIHHLSDPLPFLQEIRRVVTPEGGIFLRDLLRPDSEEAIERMVASIGPEYSPHQAKLFGDSLRAAFTLPEIEDLLQRAGLEGVRVYRSSDRHWTALREGKK
ncbi:class I SAM-dependent methyltransferase [Pannus brasiliensis CCIBt3594]|uniref:Class I SAM-dependent methyltransferase n=1 Tax=Pannus brasiliensis CCIBt3594 TaxID=1427578 RepID=A0AAW9QHQ5_9CHRO